jgi:hypothetical protein
MKTESFKQGEKSIIENSSEEGEPSQYMPNGRDVLFTSRIRRGIRNIVNMDGEVLRKSLLAYNRSVLLYLGPIFYIVYFIAQKI